MAENKLVKKEYEFKEFSSIKELMKILKNLYQEGNIVKICAINLDEDVWDEENQLYYYEDGSIEYLLTRPFTDEEKLQMLADEVEAERKKEVAREKRRARAAAKKEAEIQELIESLRKLRPEALKEQE